MLRDDHRCFALNQCWLRYHFVLSRYLLPVGFNFTTSKCALYFWRKCAEM